ncbi:hypothetical protein BLOT_013878 [Blomia tropicalis]|nr:hypothetical protein BLOT_013878 [Blomia tropicalis]
MAKRVKNEEDSSNKKLKRRYECSFNKQLADEFKFIKIDKSEDQTTQSKVKCTLCKSRFDIRNEGRKAITDHIKSLKHQNIVKLNQSCSTIPKLFSQQTMISDKIRATAVAEVCFSYYNLIHNHSFRDSTDLSQLINLNFDKAYHCSKTKTRKIAIDVLATHFINVLRENLLNSKFVTIFSDTSNFKSTKIFPVLVRFFDFKLGIQTKILNITNLPGESSEIITNSLIDTISNENINSKVIAYCADNARVNFGNIDHQGENNVLSCLRNRLDSPIIGIGCGAHILNNAIQYAVGRCPFKIKTFLSQVYVYFSISTIRNQKLLNFCEIVGEEYKTILGFSPTRWLSMSSASRRIDEMYEALKLEFLELDSSEFLCKYFLKKSTRIWIKFLYYQSSQFEQTVKLVESDNSTAIDVYKEINELIQKLKVKSKYNFIPKDVLDLVNELDYLESEKLNKQFELNEVKISLEFVKTFKLNFDSDYDYDEEIMFEFENLKELVTIDQLKKWEVSQISTSKRWIEIFEIFKKQNKSCALFKILIEFALILPGTNAVTERIFSKINQYWSKEKAHLQVSTLNKVMISDGTGGIDSSPINL